MYEVLRRKGRDNPVISIVMDTKVDTFDTFDKIIDRLQGEQEYTNHVWLEDLNGEDEPTECAILKLYGN